MLARQAPSTGALESALALNWLEHALQADALDFLLKSARTVPGEGKHLLP